MTDFHDLTLYLVKPTKRSLFFNKAYTLVYGMFLKHFVKQCKILYYKQPSRVYKVDYRKITVELWKTDISDKPAEDIRIKKLIANVNFGLLEKNTNKAHKSYARPGSRGASKRMPFLLVFRLAGGHGTQLYLSVTHAFFSQAAVSKVSSTSVADLACSE